MNFKFKVFSRWLYLDCRTNWKRYFLLSFGVHFIFMAQIIFKTLLIDGGHLQANTVAFFSLEGLNSSVAIYVASSFFTEFHDRLKSPMAMLLPVSQGEKFAGKLLLSLAIWNLSAFSLSAMSSSLPMSEILELKDFLAQHKIDIPMGFTWSSLISPVHAIFFAGGVFFSKAPLFKTLIASALYLIVFGLIFFIFIPQSAVYINWPEQLSTLIPDINYRLAFEDKGFISALSDGYIIFKIVFCLLIYLASWFRFRELEVK